MRGLETILDRAKGAAQRCLARLRGEAIVPEARRPHQVSHDPSTPLPPGATRVLRHDHPRLIELRREYSRLEWPVCQHTFWSDEAIAANVKLQWFRGDNAYVWQYRQLGADAPRKISDIHAYVAARDRLGLLDRLTEDGLFGVWTFDGPRGRLSRDLLDSVNEISFLERELGVSRLAELKVVDIGAGYGRLAHRFCAALDNVARFDCVDAVAESTFLCEYYVRFRGVQDRAHVIALPDLDHALPGAGYFLALNIHSFSECTYAGIRWWLQRLAADRTPYLLIVPNHYDRPLSAELDGSQRDYTPLLQEAGYRLRRKEPIYDDPAVRERVGVLDFFMLYERTP